VSLIRASNIASLRMSFRTGTRPIHYVKFSQFLFRRRYRVSRELPPKAAAVLERITSVPGPRHRPPVAPPPDPLTKPRSRAV
jgi:hypothetical protein